MNYRLIIWYDISSVFFLKLSRSVGDHALEGSAKSGQTSEGEVEKIRIPHIIWRLQDLFSSLCGDLGLFFPKGTLCTFCTFLFLLDGWRKFTKKENTGHKRLVDAAAFY